MRVLVRLSAIGWALAGLAAAQTAATLIGDADAATRQAVALRASGRMTVRITAAGASQTTELSFRVARRHPSEARFEFEGDAFPMLTLCWNRRRQSYYFLEGLQSASEGATEQSCVPAELSGHLADGLVSAVDAGYEPVEFDGRAVECRVVRAEYRPAQGLVSVAPGSWAILRNIVRTLWIEPTHKLVLRSRLEARIANAGVFAPIQDGPDLPALVLTTTYATVENLPDLPAEEFAYQPRQNFSFVDHPPSLLGTLAPGKPATQPVGPPDGLLLYRRDPDYTPKALADRIQGVVTVSATIGPDGVPREMRVLRSLDPELDQKAIECVAAWRFRPGATTAAMIDVRFRLPRE
ncbi:MAG: energy transducer TonB [Candidatus Sulfopaludibacter sp.]|nr:energy transducer TonB [Candidatus Sulfopaludibacter sp.]